MLCCAVLCCVVWCVDVCVCVFACGVVHGCCVVVVGFRGCGVWVWGGVVCLCFSLVFPLILFILSLAVSSLLSSLFSSLLSSLFSLLFLSSSLSSLFPSRQKHLHKSTDQQTWRPTGRHGLWWDYDGWCLRYPYSFVLSRWKHPCKWFRSSSSWHEGGTFLLQEYFRRGIYFLLQF